MRVTVESSEMLPEGGRDRLARLFYHPIYADGERRASLGGSLRLDVAAGLVLTLPVSLHINSTLSSTIISLELSLPHVS